MQRTRIPPTSAIVYEGPSDTGPGNVAVVITGLLKASHNAATGPMSQVWYLDRDTPPHQRTDEADRNTGCHGCPIRRACYVTRWQAPKNIWEHYQAGGYQRLDTAELWSPYAVRLGADGDPLCHWSTTKALIGQLGAARGWTGYTQRWRQNPDHEARQYLMASCISEREADKAEALGWAPFIILPEGAEPPANADECPKQVDPGRSTCATCLRCAGRSEHSDAIGDRRIWTHAHGNRRKHHPLAA